MSKFSRNGGLPASETRPVRILDASASGLLGLFYVSVVQQANAVVGVLLQQCKVLRVGLTAIFITVISVYLDSSAVLGKRIWLQTLPWLEAVLVQCLQLLSFCI